MKKVSKRNSPPGGPGTASCVVGRVTPRERDEIRALYERKNGLNELVLSLQDNKLLSNPLFYEKVVVDLGKTSTDFTRWWDEKAKTYGWPKDANGHWSIDFETCEIVLGR